jgi:hypothetical protein
VWSFKNLLQNHWANFNQTWHKSYLGEEIQVCTNVRDCPSPRGDNSETKKYTEIFKKKSSSPEPAGQIQSNLVQIILGWREFKFVQIKGQILFKGEIITKMSKWGGVI